MPPTNLKGFGSVNDRSGSQKSERTFILVGHNHFPQQSSFHPINLP